jgi:predicted HAD superfamily hydrolase
MLYIFDVFNTIIMPKTATFQGVFALMQKELQENPAYQKMAEYIKDNFYELRIHAEDLARSEYQRNGIEEISLEQIYDALATTGEVREDDIRLLMTLERCLLIENSYCINEMVSRIKVFLAAGERVVLAGDTYFDETTIIKILQKADPALREVRLYLSSMYKVTKASGKLYQIIKEKEAIPYNNWKYIGEKQTADKKILMRLGVDTELVFQENLWDIEKQVLKNHCQDVFYQVVTGTAKRVRSQYNLSGAEAMGCSIGGPVLFAYVQWIFIMCRLHKIHRLYFIARDGYIPKKIIDILCQGEEYKLSTHYIYGSRKTWRWPAYSGKPGHLRKLIGMSYPDKIETIKGLADILELPCEQLYRFLPVEYRKSDIIALSALLTCIKILDENKSFRDLLYTRWQSKRVAAQNYLVQEIDFSDDHFAFVEIGGTGFTQECLAEIIHPMYSFPIRTFFFKMDRIRENENCIYYNFLPSKLKSHLIVELLSRATHEQACGYETVKNSIVPTFNGAEGQSLKEYGYDEYVDGIEKFCREYASLVKAYHLPVRAEAVFKYLKYIMEYPDKAVLRFIADMPHGASGREKKMAAFAPALTKKNIRDVYLFHPGQPVVRYYEGTDIDYARLRCSEGEKRKIAFYQKNRDVIIDRLQRLTKRSFVEIQEENNNLFRGFPYSYFGSTFVLYGAGKWGTQFHDSAIAANCHIVQWLDKNYRRLAAKELSVSGALSDLDKNAKYDAVFVAVSNQQAALEIKNEMLTLGVDEKKIVILFEYMSILDI